VTLATCIDGPCGARSCLGYQQLWRPLGHWMPNLSNVRCPTYRGLDADLPSVRCRWPLEFWMPCEGSAARLGGVRGSVAGGVWCTWFCVCVFLYFFVAAFTFRETSDGRYKIDHFARLGGMINHQHRKYQSASILENQTWHARWPWIPRPPPHGCSDGMHYTKPPQRAGRGRW